MSFKVLNYIPWLLADEIKRLKSSTILDNLKESD